MSVTTHDMRGQTVTCFIVTERKRRENAWEDFVTFGSYMWIKRVCPRFGERSCWRVGPTFSWICSRSPARLALDLILLRSMTPICWFHAATGFVFHNRYWGPGLVIHSTNLWGPLRWTVFLHQMWTVVWFGNLHFKLFSQLNIKVFINRGELDNNRTCMMITV